MTIFLRAYATIPDFINHLLGTNLPRIPINTYGFFVALGFLAAAVIAGRELKRRGELGLLPSKKATIVEGEKVTFMHLLSPIIIGFILGFKVVGAFFNDTSLLTNGQNTVSYLLSLQGFWIWGLITAAVFGGVAFFLEKRKELPQPIKKEITLGPEESIGELVIVAAIFGVAGSSIFEVLQPNSTMTFVELFSDPMNFISGLTIFGGLFFGILGIFLYSKFKKIKPFLLFDSLAPAFIFANGIGRLGCHFSGDGDWGKANLSEAPSFIPDWAWSNSYAHNVLNQGVKIAGCEGNYCNELAVGVWPTSIYEFIMLTALFGVLYLVRKKFTLAPGFMFALFFVLAGIERFPIEYLRVTDTYPAFFNFTQAQIISVVMIILGSASMVYLYITNKEKIDKSSFK